MLRPAPIFVIVAATLWGIDGILLRPMLYSLPVPTVVFTESAIVILLLSPLLFKRYKSLFALSYSEWIYFFLIALFGGAIGTMAITKALFYVNFVNLSIVILIQKLQPVFALTLAAILIKEKLPRVFFLWASIAILGTYLMTFGFSLPNLETGEETILAGLFALLAAFSFGSSTVFSKMALRNIDFALATYLRFLFATIILLVVVLVAGDFNSFADISIDQFMVFLLIAFTTGGAAIFLYYYGLKHVSASVATICELAFPLSAVILEYFLRDNILYPVQWIGVVMLFISIIQVTKVNKKSNP